MKSGIHPKWYPEAKVVCGCGNTFTVGATVPTIQTEICASCHPFFTGEQRIVDTAGQVERFMRRLEVGTQQRVDRVQQEAERKQAELEARRRRRGLTPLAAAKKAAAKAAAGKATATEAADVESADEG